MIRFIHCVKSRADISAGDFRHCWNSPEFSGLWDRLILLTGARHCERNLTLLIELNTQLMDERGAGDPFDGLIEVWWDDAREFEEKVTSDAFQELLQEMETYQSQFIDFTASRRFFTEWDSDLEK